MRVALVLVVLIAALSAPAWARDERSPADARARMDHHLQEVSRLAQHFDGLLGADCPRFTSPRDWTTYLDGEIDQVVLLVAHLEQAWYEATRTGDDDVRRTAKAPRKRLDQARALMDKFQGCAEDNGAPFSSMSVWRRIEREVPQKQTEIALPQ